MALHLLARGFLPDRVMARLAWHQDQQSIQVVDVFSSFFDASGGIADEWSGFEYKLQVRVPSPEDPDHHDDYTVTDRKRRARRMRTSTAC